MRRASHDVQHFVGDGAAAVATSVDIIGAAEKPLSPTATIADDVAARPRSRSISDGRTRFEIRRLTTGTSSVFVCLYIAVLIELTRTSHADE